MGTEKAKPTPISGAQAIREVFQFSSLKLLRDELQELAPADKKELAELSAKALGRPLKA